MADNPRLRSRRTSPPNDTEQNAPRKRARLTSPPLLCAQCRLLKLERSFDRAWKFYKSARDGATLRSPRLHTETPKGPFYYEDCFLVHRFKDRLASASQCQLCTYFRSMRVQPNQHRNYKLLAFCSSESAIFCRPRLINSSVWERLRHTVFMAVVPDPPNIPPRGHEEHWLEKEIPAVGLIYRLCPGEADDGYALLNARQLGEKIDFSIPQKWLAFCNSHHDKLCKRSAICGTIEHSFRLIDCHKDDPIPEVQPWGTTYAALSYVWGTDKEEWPKTVRDAIIVTREMGLQYLWVDRLCINQKDEKEKDYLVAKMTLVYTEADFTIVAAAGSGANYGIPGVGNTPRKLQPKFELESGSVLVSTMQDPRLEIEDSVWSTRGWTYQEGILSNRRLIFTDHQVYWECRCMAVHDSISLPLQLCHNLSQTRMNNFMRGGIFKAISYSAGVEEDNGDILIGDDSYRLDYGFPSQDGESIRGNLRGLDEHIRAFTMRILSFNTDSLRALLGVLGLYNQKKQLNTLLGIPIWVGPVAGRLAGTQITFALSLCSWYHRTSEKLRMFVSERCPRRSQLPSWTWAGWKGAVSWRSPPQDEHSSIMCNLIEANDLDFLWAADIQLHDSSLHHMTRLADVHSFHDLSPENIKFVQIDAPLILKYFTTRRQIKKEWTWYRLAGREGRKKYDAGSMDWDAQWWRLSGWLVWISVSVSMTRAEWTEKHFEKELISVLVFFGRDPAIKHGRARFLTLRRVKSSDADQEMCWERIGIVQLTVADSVLAQFENTKELLDHLPVELGNAALVIQ